MRAPSRSRAKAGTPGSRPSRAARRRFAPAGRDRAQPGSGQGPPGPRRSSGPARGGSPLGRATGRAQTAGLDDLPLDGKAPSLTEPAQAPHDLLVAQLFGGSTIVADHELAFVRMFDIAASNECARSLDLVDQLVREQEFERTVDGGRPELAAPALQFTEQRVGPGRLIR